MSAPPHSPTSLPVIDIAAMLDADASAGDMTEVAAQVDAACREVGFFGITGHGIGKLQQAELEAAAHRFFQRPDDRKAEIAMATGALAWRGWFPVGGELTSGVPDRKEGVYFGTEHTADHPRVLAGTPLHGPNRFPQEPEELRDAVLGWLDAMRPVADAVMRAFAVGLGLRSDWFEQRLTDDPTILFRIFHYPPSEPAGDRFRSPSDAPDDRSDDDEQWGVGEHTDYGLLTLLAQDRHGGLQVRTVDGGWLDVEPTPGVIVCNLGDMLERLTGGRYRSTPHRVRNTSGSSRLSFPYFLDPSWDATVPTLPIDHSPPADRHQERWDGDDVTAWQGTYGDYLTRKVANVFPELFASISDERGS